MNLREIADWLAVPIWKHRENDELAALNLHPGCQHWYDNPAILAVHAFVGDAKVCVCGARMKADDGNIIDRAGHG